MQKQIVCINPERNYLIFSTLLAVPFGQTPFGNE